MSKNAYFPPLLSRICGVISRALAPIWHKWGAPMKGVGITACNSVTPLSPGMMLPDCRQVITAYAPAMWVQGERRVAAC
jgi:hypothetical protein